MPVYDILNAGPRHRFCTANFVAHNCLGLGYGLGPSKSRSIFKQWTGGEISARQAEDMVRDFRNSNQLLTQFWRRMERLARNSVGGEMEVELPSGRTILYRDVCMREGDVVGRPVAGEPHRKLYGGLLTENCLAGHTQVFSELRGWVSLESVTLRDRVWDGEQFVTHSGLVSKGMHAVLSCHGCICTPDHHILSTKGWVQAEIACRMACAELQMFHHETESLAVDRPFGSAVRPSDRDKPVGFRRKEELLACEVRLREGDGEGGVRAEKRESPNVWPRVPILQEVAGAALAHPRNESASGICCVAVDAGPLPTPHSPSMEELRRSRDRCLRSVERGLSKFLGGCSGRVLPGLGVGPNRQRSGVLSRECSLGPPIGEFPKSEEQCSEKVGSPREFLGFGPSLWSEEKHALLSGEHDGVELGEDTVNASHSCE